MAVNEHDGDDKDALLSRLYREVAREEPPAHLDRAIAAAARASVGRRSSPAPARSPPWWTPWRLPFAFAALAVVSVSLVTLMMEEDPTRVASVPALPPPAAQEREAAKIAQAPVEAPASNTAPIKPEEPRRAQRQDTRKLEPEFVPEPPPASSSRGELARTDRAAPLAEAGPRELQKAPGSEAPPPAQDAIAAGAVGARSEVQARRSEDRAAAAPPPPPVPAAETASAPLGDARAPAARSAPQPAAKPAPTPKASIGIRGLERDGYAMQARPSPEVARHIVELEGKPPSAWIERVLTLRRDARMAEADGLLAEFRRRFPNEPLPAELQ